MISLIRACNNNSSPKHTEFNAKFKFNFNFKFKSNSKIQVQNTIQTPGGKSLKLTWNLEGLQGGRSLAKGVFGRSIDHRLGSRYHIVLAGSGVGETSEFLGATLQSGCSGIVPALSPHTCHIVLRWTRSRRGVLPAQFVTKGVRGSSLLLRIRNFATYIEFILY